MCEISPITSRRFFCVMCTSVLRKAGKNVRVNRLQARPHYCYPCVHYCVSCVLTNAYVYCMCWVIVCVDYCLCLLRVLDIVCAGFCVACIGYCVLAFACLLRVLSIVCVGFCVCLLRVSTIACVEYYVCWLFSVLTLSCVDCDVFWQFSVLTIACVSYCVYWVFSCVGYYVCVFFFNNTNFGHWPTVYPTNTISKFCKPCLGMPTRSDTYGVDVCCR